MKIEPGQVKDIFLHAIEKRTPGELGAYLDRACGGNAELPPRDGAAGGASGRRQSHRLS